LHPLLILAGLGVGALQGIIDCFVQYKGSLFPQGLAELANAGLKLPVPGRALYVSHLIRITRIVQGCTFGFLGGLVFMLAANGTDIRAYIDEKFMAENHVVAEESARMVDAGIARSRDALSLETAELNNLSRAIQSLRTSDVRRAIAAGRKTSQPSAPASDVQLAALEKRLADETARRDTLKAAVDAQETGRNAAIEISVSNAPHHIPRRNGLSAQLGALSALTREDPKLLLLILAFELISLALELGPMFCAATYVPSAYAARVALDHFEEVTKVARSGAERLGVLPQEVPSVASAAEPQDTATSEDASLNAAPPKANDTAVDTSAMNGATPPRRGPGRPRKGEASGPAGSTDHE
jgi:hypothetical protein